MASLPAYQLTPRAYTKIALHSAKYPASSLLGLLVGRASSSSSSGGPAVIEDVIPLVHKWTQLSPTVEAGCALAEAHLDGTGSRIIGCYEAPARAAEGELSQSAIRLAQRIANRTSGDALILLVNNALLLSPTLIPFTPSLQSPFSSSSSSSSAPKPRPLPAGVKSISLAAEAGTSQEAALRETAINAASLLQKGTWSDLADLDDHLSDPKLDWLQNSAIAQLVA